MSIVKSFSVGKGDMFYIKHGSDNFTIIDCNYVSEEERDRNINEIKTESMGKHITRFISTHPDKDHIYGLSNLDDELNILNFYCVSNSITKEEEFDDFNRYCQLRDDEKKHFFLYKGCSRKWMNETDNDRGSSGINILWPDLKDEIFIGALKEANKVGGNANNISPIITYSINEGARFMWMGDLETSIQKEMADKVNWPKVDILFAPHHGRKSGRVPKEILEIISPKLIVVGEAPSDELEYYCDYNTITQNSAKDIVFNCDGNRIHIYVGNKDYCISGDFLQKTCDLPNDAYGTYLGSFKTYNG